MKKFLLMLGILFILCGCSVKLSANFSVETKISKECNNEAVEYYSQDNQKVYLVCLDKITLKDDKHKISLKKYLKEKDTSLEDKTNNLIRNLIGDTSLLDGSAEIYRDGGTTKYTNNGYTIIKCNTSAGNKDIYIGTDKLDINKGFEQGFCGHND